MKGGAWSHGHSATVGGLATLAVWGYRPWLLLALAFLFGWLSCSLRNHIRSGIRFIGRNAFRRRTEW